MGPHEQQLGTNAGPVQARLGALGGHLVSAAIACEPALISLGSIMVGLGTLLGHRGRASNKYPDRPGVPNRASKENGIPHMHVCAITLY